MKHSIILCLASLFVVLSCEKNSKIYDELEVKIADNYIVIFNVEDLSGSKLKELRSCENKDLNINYDHDKLLVEGCDIISSEYDTYEVELKDIIKVSLRDYASYSDCWLVITIDN